MVGQMNRSAGKAEAEIDAALTHVGKSNQRLRKKYALAKLLDEMPDDLKELLDDPEIKAWMNSGPVGHEIL